MEEFSAESLKLKPEHLKNLRPVEKSVARKRQKLEFVQITRQQSERLDKVGHAAEIVFRHLMFLDWKSPGRTIKLGNNTLPLKGISRHAKNRALDRLKEVGLIKLKKHPRKSPQVVIRSLR
jgi:hypothetical protein